MVLAPDEAGYPALLRVMTSPPVLWVRGALADEDALAIAIVGSRQATPYGLEVAERLGADLAARGITIVSGLARGVDTAAHRGALAAGGRTIAVLGCGIDVLYPPESGPLVAEIVHHGAVLSQFPPGAPPHAIHFPARNRILAGLALGVVVVEATERSGALITAGHAGDLGREVFAVPGRITSDTSAGPNGLIAEGAKLVRGWSDVVQELPEPWRRSVVSVPVISGADIRGIEASGGEVPTPDTEEARVLAMLTVDEPQHIEQLIARSGLPAGRVTATLGALEIIGRVRQLGGQRWVTAAPPRARRA
jgi:DNA processing protein